MKKIVWIFLVLILFFPLFSVQGSEPYTIEDYQVDIQVEKSAHLNVEETIQVKDCHQLFIQKDLIQDYTYDANQDGQSELYSYGIDHIEIIGGDVTKTSHDGVVSLKIHLNESNAQIKLKYQVRMRKYDIKEANLFIYQLLASSNEATIRQLRANITFPNVPRTAFDVGITDANGNVSKIINSQIDHKTLTFQTMHPLAPGQGISVKAKLNDFFFTYSNAFSTSLYLTMFSILLVIATYALTLYRSRIHKKNLWMECRPLKKFQIGSIGYIVDGYCDSRDIMSIIIDWANKNYIQIRNENQTIYLAVVKELPANAMKYEHRLFQLIFNHQRIMTIDQLAIRSLYKEMGAIEEEIFKAQKTRRRKVYTNDSYLSQLGYIAVVGIPISIGMFACIYEQNYQWMKAVQYAIGCYGVVYLNCLPWIWVLKYQYRLSKNTYQVYQTLISLINFVCGALIYAYLLTNGMAVVYAAINLVMTLLMGCVALFMDKPTHYGRIIRLKLYSLREFICKATREQLSDMMNENSYYFGDMLPYVYFFDISDIWSKQFSSIPLQAPFWYFHANADAQSTVYWMSSLILSLEKIQDVLYYDPTPLSVQKPMKEKKTKEKKKKQPF